MSKIFEEVMSDVNSVGRIFKRSRFDLEYVLKPLKVRLKEVNSQHKCDICEKISLEMCNLCSGCDTFSTWICEACNRNGNCPPCAIRKRIQNLNYEEMIKFETTANTILNIRKRKEVKHYQKLVLEELGYFHFLKRRERQVVIGRSSTIKELIRLL